MDDYWYYSLLTLVMLMLFESTVTNTRLRTLGDMRRLATPMQVPLPPHVTPVGLEGRTQVLGEVR